jgi:hypothetical protein
MLETIQWPRCAPAARDGKIEKRSLDKEKFRRRCIAAKMN